MLCCSLLLTNLVIKSLSYKFVKDSVDYILLLITLHMLTTLYFESVRQEFGFGLKWNGCKGRNLPLKF